MKELRDPFPEEMLCYHYPQTPEVARPRLLPWLERMFYNDQDNRTTKNSWPWYVEGQLRRCGLLPAEDLARHMSFALQMLHDGRIKIGLAPTPLWPDIMHFFLQDLFRENDIRTLKARWQDRFPIIRCYADFLRYRISMRDIVFRRHVEQALIPGRGELDRNMELSLRALLMPQPALSSIPDESVLHKDFPERPLIVHAA